MRLQLRTINTAIASASTMLRARNALRFGVVSEFMLHLYWFNADTQKQYAMKAPWLRQANAVSGIRLLVMPAQERFTSDVKRQSSRGARPSAFKRDRKEFRS